MQDSGRYPLHSYYLLLNEHTEEALRVVLHGKPYIFIADKEYFLSPKKDFFSLKEKLYILNFPYNVIWSPISLVELFFRLIFFNPVHPSCLQLNINKGKVVPYISKRGGL